MPEEPLSRAGRPLPYVIRENYKGAILFMGKVGKPEYGKQG
jgi:serine protease inhibitor